MPARVYSGKPITTLASCTSWRTRSRPISIWRRNPRWNSRSSGGYPDSVSSGNRTRSAANSARARRVVVITRVALPCTSPTSRLSCASAILNESVMSPPREPAKVRGRGGRLSSAATTPPADLLFHDSAAFAACRRSYLGLTLGFGERLGLGTRLGFALGGGLGGCLYRRLG